MENEIQYLMERYPELDPDLIRELVQGGIDAGVSPRAVEVGIRMAVGEVTGREELFTVDDLAAVLGCSREEAVAEMERHGIPGMKVTTAPGFEWALRG